MSDEEKSVPIFLGEGEDREEIGVAHVYQTAAGALELDMFVSGEYMIKSNNLPGQVRMRGIIPEPLRKVSK